MQAISAGFLAVVVLIGYMLVSEPEAHSDEVLVRGEAGVEVVERKPFEYARPKAEVAAPAVLETEVQQAVPREESRAPAVLPVPWPVIVLPPPPPPEPPAPSAPAQDPAVTACLGKFAGNECSFMKDGIEHPGSCITPAWSSLTCVPF